MLVELSIRDLVLIEEARVEPRAGLNVITGETGAGKSLCVDALELLLGRRAKALMVRKGAERARVEGRFELESGGYGTVVEAWLGAALPEVLAECERTEAGELELILTRTIGSDGRSRAHVNHRPVTQKTMRELAGLLVEIHGQHEHQRLFEVSEQLRLVDAFGELEELAESYGELRAEWLALGARLVALDSGESERLQQLDLLRFQAAELEEAAPDAEEASQLLSERGALRYASELRNQLGGIVYDLSEADDSALDKVRAAERSVVGWADKVPDLEGVASSFGEASGHLEDAMRGLDSFLSGIDEDPARLEEVEQRLDLLETLQRKYRTDIAGLVERRETLAAELDGLEEAHGGREELVAAQAAARETLARVGRELGDARRALVPRLVKEVERGLKQLGLEKARFKVDVQSHSKESGGDHFGARGTESVEFLLAANPGEDPQPLRAVASGGEAARIMLALRGALSVRRSTPTLVFDEVDAGVGGRLGPRVGAHLRQLGEHHQVLCVTHLAAIAAGASQHLRVQKSVRSGRTRTVIERLEGDARVAEIAEMLAGGGEAKTARAEAKRLLESAS